MNEIEANWATGATLYALIRDQSNNVWQTTTQTFVPFVLANVANYAVSLQEIGAGSGYYAADFPLAVTLPGNYPVTAYRQVGGSPNGSNDLAIANGVIVWGGSAEVPLSGSLTTLSYIKEVLGLTATTYDQLLYDLIAAASATIQTYCHRTFAQKSYTEYHDGRGDFTLLLTNYPVASLTQLTLDAQGSSPEVVPGSDCIVDGKSGRVQVKPTSSHTRYFRDGFQNIQAQYVAGLSPIPADLQHACVMVVKTLYMQRGVEQLAQSRRTSNYAITYRKELAAVISESSDVQQILNRYKDYVVGG